MVNKHHPKSTEFLSFISKKKIFKNVQLKEFPTMSRSNPSKTQAKQGLARSKSSLTKGSPNPRANSCDFGARCVMSIVMDKWNSDFLGDFWAWRYHGNQVFQGCCTSLYTILSCCIKCSRLCHIWCSSIWFIAWRGIIGFIIYKKSK